MTEVDFTIEEIRAELRALKDLIGIAAYVSVDFSVGGYSNENGQLSACCYPKGVGLSSSLRVQGDTWREVIERLKARWAETQETYEAETTRRMALAVIDITNRLGECSDAALRGDGFNHTEVKRFGPTACALATEMAAGGPFAIISHDATRNEPLEAA